MRQQPRCRLCWFVSALSRCGVSVEREIIRHIWLYLSGVLPTDRAGRDLVPL
jgi:hypothetical protein